MKYETMDSAGVAAKPATMSDRISSFASQLNDVNLQIGEVLSRIYGPEPEAVDKDLTGCPCMTTNMEAVDKQIARLFRNIKRLHGVA